MIVMLDSTWLKRTMTMEVFGFIELYKRIDWSRRNRGLHLNPPEDVSNTTCRGTRGGGD